MRYGYVRQSMQGNSGEQYCKLVESGLEFDGGIAINVDWARFISDLERGDEVVVVSKSRVSRDVDEFKARCEMLELIGVRLVSLYD